MVRECGAGAVRLLLDRGTPVLRACCAKMGRHDSTALALTAALALAVGSAGSAVAQGCGAEIDRLAQQYNLSTEAPRAGTSEMPAAPGSPPAGTSEPATSDRLARSGGVITPPDIGAPMAIRPPHDNPDRMATAPPVVPSPPTSRSGDSGGLGAADRARMESLLQAARAAERQGKEAQCLERLREAEAVPHAPSAK